MDILNQTGKSKVLHVKIPKNGTNSITKFLEEKNLDNWNRTIMNWDISNKKTNTIRIFEHDPFFALKDNNILSDDVFVFAVSRNPYTRFFSQYKYLVRSYKIYSNISFFDFYNYVKNKKIHPLFTAPQIKWVSKEDHVILEKTISDNAFSIHFESTDNLGNKPIIDNRIDKFYKIENIKEFEKDFNTRLEHLHASNYSLTEYKKSFTEEIKKFIIDYYKEDFKNFGYDFDFEYSVIELKTQRKKLLCSYYH